MTRVKRCSSSGKHGRMPVQLIATIQSGFSLIEMSVVLLIIAVMASVATMGSGLLTNVNGIRVQTDFINAWRHVYDVAMKDNKNLPGDDVFEPTHRINKALSSPLCNSADSKALSDVFLEKVGRVMDLPTGRGPNEPDLYLVNDKDGVPRLLSVCFATVLWSTQVGKGNFELLERHVMVIKGLTKELVTQLDVAYDAIQNARYGDLRSANLAASLKDVDVGWGDPDNYQVVYLRLVSN